MNLFYWADEWKQVLLLTLAPLAVAAVLPRFPRERSHESLRRGFDLELKPCVDRLPAGGAFGAAVGECTAHTPCRDVVVPGFPLPVYACLEKKE